MTEARDLSKAYGEKTAAGGGASFVVQPERVMGVLGTEGNP